MRDTRQNNKTGKKKENKCSAAWGYLLCKWYQNISLCQMSFKSDKLFHIYLCVHDGAAKESDA